jgi:hypothetical protein
MGKGWYYCTGCRDKFTVRVGTIYERSHIPLHKWVIAMHLMAASKKGISANQLHRMLGITYKSAWFMAYRIRKAMEDDSPAPMGGTGSAVKADETYFGRKKGATRKRGGAGHKRAEGKRLMYRRTGFRAHVQACTDSEAISCSIA